MPEIVMHYDMVSGYMGNLKKGQKIVRCKECANRTTADCPMYFEERIEWEEDGYIEVDYVEHDNTKDDYFCSCGEERFDVCDC